ncbi:MAG: hypothetical protein JNM46_05330 [Anaerolineales bacterium]|nr:hypothetical protein [Anaerolineales bacterium]
MKSRTTENASIDKTEKGYILKIPSGDSSAYRFAQIDDYFGLKRKDFPHHSLTLSLRARTSAFPLSGTWGFGLWNDPFGMSLGFGGNKFRLPTLPNAAWFFGASKENHLSFQNDKPANGFIAQSFRSPKFHPLLIPAGFVFPFSKEQTRKLMGKIIEEDSKTIDIDTTEWHSYKLEWNQNQSLVAWYIDDIQIFESQVNPNPPLGLVIWIDNQFASFTPDGKLSFGVLAGDEAWLEIADLELN